MTPLVIFSADNGPEHYAYERVRKFQHRSMGQHGERHDRPERAVGQLRGDVDLVLGDGQHRHRRPVPLSRARSRWKNRPAVASFSVRMLSVWLEP